MSNEEGGFQLENSSNNVFRNNLSENNQSGFDLDGSSDNNVFDNNTARNNNEGFDMRSCSNNTLENNRAENNDSGFCLNGESGDNLENNQIENNFVGMRLENSHGLTLKYNTLSNNRYNFGVASSYSNQIDNTNMVNGKQVLYLEGKSDITINQDNEFGYLGLANCDNVTIENVELENNLFGLWLGKTDNSWIENVHPSKNAVGILLENSHNNHIVNSLLQNNGLLEPGGGGEGGIFGGILLAMTSNNVVENNTIKDGAIGIMLMGSNGDNIINNTLDNNGVELEEGRMPPAQLLLMMASNSTVENNTIENGLFGLLIAGSDNAVMRGNALENNTVNFGLMGEEGSPPVQANLMSHDIDNTNTINGKPIYYLKSENDLVINQENDPGFLALISCDNILAENLMIENNFPGVLLVGTDNSTLRKDNFVHNVIGVRVINGENNLIYLNKFIAPEIQTGMGQAMDNRNNFWDNGSVGNLWSDYTGSDSNDDNIGDTPYEIPENNQDNYPLMGVCNSKPSLVSPPNNTTTDNTPTFRWTRVGDYLSPPVTYEIEIDNNENFGSVENTKSGISNNFVEIEVYADNYYWRVRAKNNAGEKSAWSDNWLFIVDNVPPSSPTPEWPENNENISENTPTVYWDPPPDDISQPLTYQVWIDNNKGFTSPENSGWLENENYPITPPLAEGWHYWKVQAKDNVGNIGDNSAWRRFRVDQTPPSFIAENAIIARTRDNQPTYCDTNLHYYFENDNIYIVAKMTEPNLTVWADFSDLGKDNHVSGVTMTENENWYLITYPITNFDNQGGYGVPVIAMDNAGNPIVSDGNNGRPDPFITVMNINPKENAQLGLDSDNTTDWRNINDFTNVENLTFERMIGSNPIGKLRFIENIDLCDMTTVHAIENLGNNLNIALAEMSLNTAPNALAAMDENSELTMYGLDNFVNSPGILKDGVPVLKRGAPTNENVPDLDWDNDNKILVFRVPHWSTYEADGESPTCTIDISHPTISEDDAGENFTLTVTYSENMNPDNYPVISFTPDVTADNTLFYLDNWWSANNTVYCENYGINDENVENADINITVTGGRDLVGYAQIDNTGENMFDVDTVMPVISGVSASNISTSSATISWTTDENSDSVVEYGTTTSYGITSLDTSLVTSHSLTISGLSSGTTYHYRVKSADEANNESVSSDHTFTTGGEAEEEEEEEEAVNESPTADAGGPYSVTEGETVELDGTGSSDPDGSIASYSWSITNDPIGGASLTDSDTATPVFHAPSVENDADVVVELTVTDDNDATASDNATVTVLALPPAPSAEDIENMSPENAAENLVGSDPESAARMLENVSPENAGRIIDASVEMGLTDNIADILNRMDASKAALIIISAESHSSARIIESIIGTDIDSAALITDNAAKQNLERTASIAENIETASLSDLLVEIYDLPETPEVAGDLLGAMSLDKSTAVVQTLIGRGDYSYVNGMFGHLTDERLNSIWNGLTQGQKDALLPYLSSQVVDRITAPEPSEPFPWATVAVVIIAIIIILAVAWYWAPRRGTEGIPRST